MKCVILCAGYATRLYPLTLNTPKPLLMIKGKPLLNYTIEKLEKIDELDEIIIVTNEKFYNNFLRWSEDIKTNKKIKILNDETKSNEDRLGGLGDLWLAIQNEKIGEDLIVIAGDNFFDFDLKDIIDFFKEVKTNVVGLYDLKDLDKSRNFGILEIDDKKRIVSFEEKPENPKSSLISTAIYIYSRDELKKIGDYMKTASSKEGPGYLIPYLIKIQDVYGFVFHGNWYDIGSKETYEEVNKK